MACGRCGGLLLACDFLEADTPGQASRCLSCGDVTDAVILDHRQHRPEPYSDATLPKYKQPATTKQAPT
jgi:hypothetical protein